MRRSGSKLCGLWRKGRNKKLPLKPRNTNRSLNRKQIRKFVRSLNYILYTFVGILHIPYMFKNRKLTFYIYILIHIVGIAALFLVPFSWKYVALFGINYFIGMFFITAGYHRYFSHRS